MAGTPSRATGRPRVVAVLVAVLIAGLVAGLGAVLAAPSASAGTSAVDGDGGARPVPEAVGRGVRPAELRGGPWALRRPAASSPQLSNGPGWRARPLLVSGATAYRGGEFIYQDYVYDDHGAGGGPATPPAPSGTFTYPTARRYAGNAADLLEVRMRREGRDLVVRLGYNSMLAPRHVASTIALGAARARAEWPHGAGATSPASVFLTVHGSTTEVVTASGRRRPSLPATVDLRRRQVEVRVPTRVFDARDRTFRVTAASGLWDPQRGRYLARGEEPTSSRPGGSAAGGSELVNVAFRTREPESTSNPWRDVAQATALAAGDLGSFTVAVDGHKLATRATTAATRDGRRADRGFLNRIVVSHVEDRQGRGDPPDGSGIANVGCGGTGDACQLAGRLQPYAIHVPDRPGADGRYGVVLDLHNCRQTYNVRLGTDHVRAFSEDGYLVVTPESRGDCYWYHHLAEVDVWEVLADVLRRYPVARDRITLGGTSMGGYGAFRLGSTFPSLFAGLAPIVPCASVDIAWSGDPVEPASGSHTRVRPLLPSLRNVPVMTWTAAADELCGYANERVLHEDLLALGYRTSYWTFTADHSSLSADRGPLAEFLHRQRVDRAPARVSYVARADGEARRWGLVGRSAYWLSDIRLAPGGDEGRLEATSSRAARPVSVVQDPPATGVLPPSTSDHLALPSYPYTREDQRWSLGPFGAGRDHVVLELDGIASVSVDLRAAGLTCAAEVEVRSPTPVVVRTPSCPGR